MNTETRSSSVKKSGNGNAEPSGQPTSIVTADVEVVGVTSLLQHRWSESAEGESGKSTRAALVVRGTPREEAEKVVYREPDGSIYHPGAAFARLIREAGGGHKLKGTRKSAKYVVPAAVLVMDDTVPLFGPDGKRLKDFEVDSRPVVIPSTKGRVMRHRPRFDEWTAKLRIRVNTAILPIAFVHQLLVEGGQQLGIGDYRPDRGGPFGTFRVVEFRE